MEKYVLLIDDDPVLNLISQRMIKNIDADITVHTFLNGKDALDYLTENFTPSRYYVILLDINMPVLNGWQFLDAFKKIEPLQQHANFEIYMVSSSTDDNDFKKAKSYRIVTRFLVKPIALDAFKDLLLD